MKAWVKKIKQTLRYILLAAVVAITGNYLYLLIVHLMYYAGCSDIGACCGIAFLSFSSYLIGSFLLIYNYQKKLHIKLLK